MTVLLYIVSVTVRLVLIPVLYNKCPLFPCDLYRPAVFRSKIRILSPSLQARISDFDLGLEYAQSAWYILIS